MTGRRTLKLQVNVAGSPTGPIKSPKKTSKNNVYPSTLVSSPVPARKRPPPNRSKSNPYVGDDFIVDDDEDDDDAFQSGPSRGWQREDTPGLGPPITTDERMQRLPEIHRDCVYAFVTRAKTVEEKIRNRKGNKRPLFSESNFREMAIGWTVTLKQMREIPGVDLEAVDSYGEYFLSLIRECSENYDQMMGQTTADRPIDKNHQTVIDLSSDDDADELSGEAPHYDGEDDEEFDLSDGMEEAMQQAEGSKYFQNRPNISSSGRQLPWQQERGRSVTSKKSGRGGSVNSYRGRGRGGRKGASRRSNGSSSSGVLKRRSSGGGKKAVAPKSGPSRRSNQANLMSSFGNAQDRGGGRGGGIAMMPV
jgi:bloom syndrome protein